MSFPFLYSITYTPCDLQVLGSICAQLVGFTPGNEIQGYWLAVNGLLVRYSSIKYSVYRMVSYVPK